MHIDAVDLIQVRNAPAPPKKKGVKSPLVEQALSTIVQITATGRNRKRFQGLGEIRAMNFLTGETPGGAFGFAQRLGRELIGREVPNGLKGWAAAEATQAVVAQTTRDILGVAAGDTVPDELHPAVRFGFDCALLDIMARAENQSVGALLEAADEPVRRNVIPRSFDDPSKLLNSLLRGHRPNGWIRGGFSKDGASLVSVLGTVAGSLGGFQGDLKGVWFNLGGRWTERDAKAMLDGLRGLSVLKSIDLEVILEQPFPHYSRGWYAEFLADLLAEAADLPVRLRVMIGDDISSARTLDGLDAILPQVDLRITPQRAGSLNETRLLIEKARTLGFSGHTYLGNAGMNTELNTLMLVTLAQTLEHDVLFSADRKQPDESNIRQAWPQVEVDDLDDHVLHLPKGAGWATQLCRSLLEKRLRKADFLRQDRITIDPPSLMSLLVLRSFDDSKLVERQIDD